MQQILFFKLLFNVKLIYSIQVLGPWLWGQLAIFSSLVVGQRKGPIGANAPPVHGIKKCLAWSGQLRRNGNQELLALFLQSLLTVFPLFSSQAHFSPPF